MTAGFDVAEKEEITAVSLRHISGGAGYAIAHTGGEATAAPSRRPTSEQSMAGTGMTTRPKAGAARRRKVRG